MSELSSIEAQYGRMWNELMEMYKAERQENKIMFAALKKIVMSIHNHKAAEDVRQIAVDAIFAVRPDLKERVEGMHESVQSKEVR